MARWTPEPFPALARWTFVMLIFASLALAGWFAVEDIGRLVDGSTFHALPPFGSACMLTFYALALSGVLYFRDRPRARRKASVEGKR